MFPSFIYRLHTSVNYCIRHLWSRSRRTTNATSQASQTWDGRSRIPILSNQTNVEPILWKWTSVRHFNACGEFTILCFYPLTSDKLECRRWKKIILIIDFNKFVCFFFFSFFKYFSQGHWNRYEMQYKTTSIV